MHLNDFARTLSPAGSGPFWRRLAERGAEALREVEEILRTTRMTPVGFDIAGASQLLVSIDRDGVILRIRSVGEGEKTRHWVGPCDTKAPIFRVFPKYTTKLERQAFLDYVYNFGQVLVDCPTGQVRPALPSEVDAATLAGVSPRWGAYAEGLR